MASGLIQRPARPIAPGKRPLSSMSPTIVSEMHQVFQRRRGSPLLEVSQVNGKPGKLRLVLGSPGGSTIITTVANDLISVVDNGLDIQAAADAPRFHRTNIFPTTLRVEEPFRWTW